METNSITLLYLFLFYETLTAEEPFKHLQVITFYRQICLPS